MVLSDWTCAELYIGIIVGSIPPCRVLFLKIWASAKSKPGPAENTIGQPNSSGSGRSIILDNLSRVGRALTRSRTSPTGSTKGSGSGWQNLERTKHGIGSHDASNASSVQNLVNDERNGTTAGGITKTVGITVTQGGYASSEPEYGVREPKHERREW